MNNKQDLHSHMISDIRNICDDKFDECNDLQKQIYDLEQSMNRISENSNDQTS
jgi:hypothetical protein